MIVDALEGKEEFTAEEIKVLKKMAQDQIWINKTFLSDEHGRPLPYRNRFETWEDAYTNLKAMGMNEDEIKRRIGENKKLKEKITK